MNKRREVSMIDRKELQQEAISEEHANLIAEEYRHIIDTIDNMINGINQERQSITYEESKNDKRAWITLVQLNAKMDVLNTLKNVLW